MGARKPEKLDLLATECNELERCKSTLDDLYYTCGATGIAIEHLLRPCNPIGLNLKSLDAQLKNLKDVLDSQFSVVRKLNKSVQEGAACLQQLKDAEEPEIVDEVNYATETLLEYIESLRPSLLQAATTCRGFHLACRLVLDFLVEEYCALI